VGSSLGNHTSSIVVDVGDLRTTGDPAAELATFALGSCVAVIVHDPVRRHGALLHFLLPHAKTNPAKARERPGLFADVGIPLLLEQLEALGSRKQDLVAKLAGGGRNFGASSAFEIGRRNHEAARELCAAAALPVAAEHCGGTRSRSVRFAVGTGRVTVRSMGEEFEL
jgi:chemotaxis protein CheD